VIQIVTLKSSPPETGFSSPGSSAYPVEPTGGGKSFQEYLERLNSPALDSTELDRPAPENFNEAPWEAGSSTMEEQGEKQIRGNEKIEKSAKESQAAAESKAKDSQKKTKVPEDSEERLTTASKGEGSKSLKADGSAQAEETGKADGAEKGAATEKDVLSLKESQSAEEKNGKVSRSEKGFESRLEKSRVEEGKNIQELEAAEAIDAAALSATPEGKIALEGLDNKSRSDAKANERALSGDSDLLRAQNQEKHSEKRGAELQLIDLRKKQVSSSPGEKKKSGKTDDRRSGAFLDGTKGGQAVKARGTGAGELSLTEQAGKANPASMEQGESRGEARIIHIDAGSTREGASGSDNGGSVKDAAAALGKRFEQDLSGKVVKQASIVLKDNKSGEIRLVLHPEKLGKVRIQLQLEDNRIAGRIFVDNTSVRDLFESNLKNLAKAFAEEGFDQTKLDVFVGSRDSGKRKEGSGETAGHFDTGNSKLAANRLETSVPLMNQYRNGDTIIDLVV
jgi:flagellar protein FlbC